jgi:lysophospholipase L1-like esterase
VYIYTGSFPKVPESAQIFVYGEKPAQPEQPEQPNQPDQPDPDRPWEGKTISVVGDSISTGSYPGILANMTGATIQNLSVSGTLLAGGLTGKISAVAEDAALVIVFGGTNDYWHKNVNIGAEDSTDAATFVGALRYIKNALETNHPNAEYLFVFPPDQTFGGNPSGTNFGKGSLDDFRAAFLHFCQTNDLHYVDLGETEFDPAIHSGDGVHPNAAGHQIIAEAIYAAITAGE